MGQNWIVQNGAKMNNEVADRIDALGMFIVYRNHHEEDADEHLGSPGAPQMKWEPDPECYPWVARYAPRSCACRTPTCSCKRTIVPVQALHLLARDQLMGGERPRKRGEVVHHKNGDKHDARIKNLGIGTRAAHARAHNQHRQKFSYRERDHLGGLYKPHQPAQVKSRPEMIGMTVPLEPRRPRPLTTKQRVDAMETRLAARWEQLSDELAHLDSGAPAPEPAPLSEWHSPKSRIHKIRRPKLELSAGGAVFVLLLVKHAFDLERVATEASEPVELLRLLWRRPAVDLAISHRRKCGWLPLAG